MYCLNHNNDNDGFPYCLNHQLSWFLSSLPHDPTKASSLVFYSNVKRAKREENGKLHFFFKKKIILRCCLSARTTSWYSLDLRGKLSVRKLLFSNRKIDHFCRKLLPGPTHVGKAVDVDRADWVLLQTIEFNVKVLANAPYNVTRSDLF